MAGFVTEGRFRMSAEAYEGGVGCFLPKWLSADCRREVPELQRRGLHAVLLNRFDRLHHRRVMKEARGIPGCVGGGAAEFSWMTSEVDDAGHARPVPGDRSGADTAAALCRLRRAGPDRGRDRH